MMNIAPLSLAAFAALLVAPVTAHAAESFDACTATITVLPVTLDSGGRYCLRNDVSTPISSGTAIEVNANNVTLDCNGFKIGNLAGGSGSTATGVLTDRLNTRITGCHFRGFKSPVMGVNAHGAQITDNFFEGGLYYGLYLAGDGTLVRANRFVDTGGATGGYAVRVDGRGEIRGNTVDGVTTGAGAAMGISGAGDFIVVDNSFSGLAGSVVGSEYGIYFFGETTRQIVEGNRLQAPTDDGVGIACGGVTIVRDNSLVGFGAPMSGCPDDGGNVLRSAEP